MYPRGGSRAVGVRGRKVGADPVPFFAPDRAAARGGRELVWNNDETSSGETVLVRGGWKKREGEERDFECD